MATFIGFLLLLVLLFYVYRAGRWAWQEQQRGTQRPSDRRVQRVVRDRGTDDVPDAAGVDTAAEFREADLSRRLMSGSIDPATYRQEMSELAHRDETRSGDAR